MNAETTQGMFLIYGVCSKEQIACMHACVIDTFSLLCCNGNNEDVAPFRRRKNEKEMLYDDPVSRHWFSADDSYDERKKSKACEKREDDRLRMSTNS